jgi:membrane protein implicated in regulation of membrane protease activity
MLDKLIIFLAESLEGFIIGSKFLIEFILILFCLPVIWFIMVHFPTFSAIVFVILLSYGAYQVKEFFEAMANRYIHKDDHKFK